MKSRPTIILFKKLPSDPLVSLPVKYYFSSEILVISFFIFLYFTDSEESNWPTLLHFGAELGLSLFCDELIKVPGMDKICHVTNSQDETPGQLARNRGFLKLAEKLDMLTVTQRDKR